MKNLLFIFLTFLFSASAFAQIDEKAAVFSNKEGAIKGYDPVAYFTNQKPVKGQSDIKLDWNGATWHFASAANRDLFSKNPEKYAPQYGGWCAYGWSQGYPAKIEPDAWSVVGGKLYLNYSLGVKKDWNEKQKQYIEQANKNYAARKKP